MNVLVATDGSKYGQWGLNWVAKLPFVKQPRVIALHVLDSAWLHWPFRTRQEVQRVEARAANTLKRAKQQLASLKLTGTARQEQGAIAPTILKRAPKRDGLLVVGSQGLDALDRFMLGSVSTKLIHHATCPVLVVKGEAVPVRRITLATDGSPASAKALAFVLTRFQPDRSTGKGRHVPIHVSVVHVIARRPLAPIEMGTTIPWIKQRELKVKEVARKLVEQSVQKLIEAGFTAEPLCRSGNPAETIMKAASKQRADLIVMGAKGLAAIDRFLLGSVSTRVVQHANCAVLVVR
ncbi:MAG TPA: universal stress protein [Nitrospiraceae bacterium]|nr:universal stress protein [Nitrospiraceae bacterium]